MPLELRLSKSNGGDLFFGFAKLEDVMSLGFPKFSFVKGRQL